jgi:hypothetical protein
MISRTRPSMGSLMSPPVCYEKGVVANYMTMPPSTAKTWPVM